MPETVEVAVLILQHPQEQDHVLSTAKPICSTLANASLTVGLSWRNLGHALGTPADGKNWGVLYLGSADAAKDKGPRRAGRQRRAAGRPEKRACGARGPDRADGNWAQAKALWWRNPWLTRLRRFVVVPDGPSLYGDLRREARPNAVSTLEAVGLALSALDGNAAVREKLRVPFRASLGKARAEGVREIKRDRRVRKRSPRPIRALLSALPDREPLAR